MASGESFAKPGAVEPMPIPPASVGHGGRVVTAGSRAALTEGGHAE